MAGSIATLRQSWIATSKFTNDHDYICKCRPVDVLAALNEIDRLRELEGRTYIAIAYRWGNVDGHWYVTAVGGNEEEITRIAEHEHGERGGKYGVEVTGVTVEGDTVCHVAYFPSSHGETKPRRNARTHAARSLGLMLIVAHESNNELCCDKHKLPDWLREVIARELAYEGKISEAFNKIRDKADE